MPSAWLERADHLKISGGNSTPTKLRGLRQPGMRDSTRATWYCGAVESCRVVRNAGIGWQAFGLANLPSTAIRAIRWLELPPINAAKNLGVATNGVSALPLQVAFSPLRKPAGFAQAPLSAAPSFNAEFLARPSRYAYFQVSALRGL